MTGPGKVRRGHKPARRLGTNAREATINYYDVLSPGDEEPGEGATIPPNQGASASPIPAQHPSATPQRDDAPQPKVARQQSAPAADGAKALRAEARPYEPGKGIKVLNSAMVNPPAAGFAEAKKTAVKGPPQ